jgi:uncharacterized protein YciI
MLTEGPTDVEAAAVAAHFAYLRRLTEQGVMVLVGRTLNNDASTMGLAVFRADTHGAAEAIMRGDPAVERGVMTATLYPFHIALRGA